MKIFLEPCRAIAPVRKKPVGEPEDFRKSLALRNRRDPFKEAYLGWFSLPSFEVRGLDKVATFGTQRTTGAFAASVCPLAE
jgi:hypothetical protein